MNKNHQLALFWEAMGLIVEYRFSDWPKNQWDDMHTPSYLLRLFRSKIDRSEFTFRLKPQ